MPQKDTVHIVALDSATATCEVALLSIRGTRRRIYTQSAAGRGDGNGGGAAQAMLPCVQAVLGEAGIGRQQLTAVAFGQGPGAFTGLRVACGVAQGLAYALDIPVVPVGSLHAMAQAAADDETVDETTDKTADETCTVRVVVQDARMGEVYAAAYSKSKNGECWQPLRTPVLLAADDVPHWLARESAAWAQSALQSGASPAICLLGNAGEIYPQLRTLPTADLPFGGQTRAAPAVRWLAQAEAAGQGQGQAAAIADLGWHFWQQGHTLPPAQAAPLYVRDKVAYTTAEREQGQGGNPRVGRGTEPGQEKPQICPSAITPTITPMQADDLDAVVEIERRTQMHPWTRSQLQDSLHADCEGWVIREAERMPGQENGKIRGFYLLMKAPDVAHLLLLGVSPECQRRGLGHALLRHGEQRTAQLALPAVLLEVRPSNQKALDFYHNRGFARIGVRKGYYPDERAGREDAWVMKKTVQKAAQKAGRAE